MLVMLAYCCSIDPRVVCKSFKARVYSGRSAKALTGVKRPPPPEAADLRSGRGRGKDLRGLLVPPQLRGRANVPTQDLERLFAARPAAREARERPNAQ